MALCTHVQFVLPWNVISGLAPKPSPKLLSEFTVYIAKPVDPLIGLVWTGLRQTMRDNSIADARSSFDSNKQQYEVENLVGVPVQVLTDQAAKLAHGRIGQQLFSSGLTITTLPTGEQ